MDVFSGVCLFVCLLVSVFVLPHDNFRTTKHKTNKLGSQVHCTEVSPEFEGQGQRSKVKVTRNKKNEKIAESSPLTMRSRACAVAGRIRSTQQQTIPLRAAGGDRLTAVHADGGL